MVNWELTAVTVNWWLVAGQTKDIDGYRMVTQYLTNGWLWLIDGGSNGFTMVCSVRTGYIVATACENSWVWKFHDIQSRGWKPARVNIGP